MLEAAYELGSPAEGYPVRIRARGLPSCPTRYSNAAPRSPAERRKLNLEGLLPSGMTTLGSAAPGLCAQ